MTSQEALISKIKNSGWERVACLPRKTLSRASYFRQEEGAINGSCSEFSFKHVKEVVLFFSSLFVVSHTPCGHFPSLYVSSFQDSHPLFRRFHTHIHTCKCNISLKSPQFPVLTLFVSHSPTQPHSECICRRTCECISLSWGICWFISEEVSRKMFGKASIAVAFGLILFFLRAGIHQVEEG